MEKPFSQACENNKAPILAVIKTYFADSKKVLEIGSGTGQHAVYFAAELSHVLWQPSDVYANIEGFERWRTEAGLLNLMAPLVLNVDEVWPSLLVDGVFSANTTHIMSWESVIRLFHGVGNCLISDGYFCLYGPFNDHGQFTSESNRAFDAMLRARDAKSGLRDANELCELAKLNQLKLIAEHEMPANNRLLVWQKM